MLSAFVHSRPLLRALLALMLFAGLLSAAAATYSGPSAGHSVAAAIDAAGVDLDVSPPDTSELDDTVSAEDSAFNDTLDVPDALTVPSTRLAASRPATTHAAPLQWHASFELRPPIV